MKHRESFFFRKEELEKVLGVLSGSPGQMKGSEYVPERLPKISKAEVNVLMESYLGMSVNHVQSRKGYIFYRDDIGEEFAFSAQPSHRNFLRHIRQVDALSFEILELRRPDADWRLVRKLIDISDKLRGGYCLTPNEDWASVAESIYDEMPRERNCGDAEVLWRGEWLECALALYTLTHTCWYAPAKPVSPASFCGKGAAGLDRLEFCQGTWLVVKRYNTGHALLVSEHVLYMDCYDTLCEREESKRTVFRGMEQRLAQIRASALSKDDLKALLPADMYTPVCGKPMNASFFPLAYRSPGPKNAWRSGYPSVELLPEAAMVCTSEHDNKPCSWWLTVAVGEYPTENVKLFPFVTAEGKIAYADAKETLGVRPACFAILEKPDSLRRVADREHEIYVSLGQ